MKEQERNPRRPRTPEETLDMIICPASILRTFEETKNIAHTATALDLPYHLTRAQLQKMGKVKAKPVDKRKGYRYR